MPTPEYFAKYPPFPDDAPVFDLPFISYKKLQEGDATEAERLFLACTTTGFLRIDFRDSEDGENILQAAQKVFELNEAIHGLGHDTLKEFALRQPHGQGYKPVGFNKMEDGRPDNVQFYNIGRDDILGTAAPEKHPEPVENGRGLLQSFFYRLYDVTEVIFGQLDANLGLPAGTLASMGRLECPSRTSVRLLRSNPELDGQPSRRCLVGHTDLGTVTIVFNTLGGLQILPVGAEDADANWRYIKPEVGCAIVNLGDAMVEWSGGILRSNMHRIVTAPGKQSTYYRHSVAYAARPEAEASMQRLRIGTVIPALAEGEEEIKLSASDWEVMRIRGIVEGKNLARSRGGRPIASVASSKPEASVH